MARASAAELSTHQQASDGLVPLLHGDLMSTGFSKRIPQCDNDARCQTRQQATWTGCLAINVCECDMLYEFWMPLSMLSSMLYLLSIYDFTYAT